VPLFEDAAQELLGDRLVDISINPDENRFVVGVYDLQPDEAELIAATLADVANADVVSRPIKAAVIDAMALAAADRFAEQLALVRPDYATGSIQIVVEADLVQMVRDSVESNPLAADGVVGGVPSEFSVVVVEGHPAVPADSLTSSPLKAGKLVSFSNGFGCTSNALVKDAAATPFVLTAGHCAPSGATVAFGGSGIGSVSYSSYYGTPTSIDGDVARFTAPSTTEPSIFIGGSSRATTSQGVGKVGLANICFFGATTQTETCGSITAINVPINYAASGSMPAHQLPLTEMDLGQGTACEGDSGSPVYQKAYGGAASLIGILSGGSRDVSDACGTTMYFTPIATALSLSSTSMVLTPGLNAPPPESVSTPFSQLMVSPDLNYDSRGDVIGVDASGKLLAYPSWSNGSLSNPPGQVGTSFTPYRVFAAGDWNGDGVSGDFIAIDSGGAMFLYKAAGGGRLQTGRTQIGSGWGAYDVAVVGDMDGDGTSDLAARNTSTGILYLYRGNGSGGFGTSTQIGSGWNTVKHYAGGDMNGDGKRDLLGVSSGGLLLRYYGTGSGGVSSGTQIGAGWTTYTLASGGVSVDSGSTPDIVARDANGGLYLYPGTGAGTYGTRSQIGNGW
jgi:hypothetical protein